MLNKDGVRIREYLKWEVASGTPLKTPAAINKAFSDWLHTEDAEELVRDSFYETTQFGRKRVSLKRLANFTGGPANSKYIVEWAEAEDNGVTKLCATEGAVLPDEHTIVQITLDATALFTEEFIATLLLRVPKETI